MSDYDVIVVGGGSPGEHCAGALAEGGLRVALVERELVGGECSYWACIPSKTLLRPGEAVHAACDAAATAEVDVDAALAWRDFMVSKYSDAGQEQWLASQGIALLRGTGRLAGTGVVEVDGVRHTAEHVVVATGAEPAFLTLPIGDDRVYCYCDVLSPRHPDSAERAPAERLTQLFSEFAEPAATLLDTLDAADIHVSTIEEVALDSWVRDHVVLIGDAAHATSPNMAQGAAMALEDALVLAHCLHDISAIPDALAAFEARRRPRTDWVRAQTHRRDHTRYLPPTVRDNVLRVLGRRIFHAHYRPLLEQP